MFSSCTKPPYSKEIKLGSSDQEASPSASKNTGVVLVPCCTSQCVPTAISGGADIFQVPWVSFVTTDEISVRVTKISSRIGVT